MTGNEKKKNAHRSSVSLVGVSVSASSSSSFAFPAPICSYYCQPCKSLERVPERRDDGSTHYSLSRDVSSLVEGIERRKDYKFWRRAEEEDHILFLLIINSETIYMGEGEWIHRSCTSTSKVVVDTCHLSADYSSFWVIETFSSSSFALLVIYDSCLRDIF